MNPAVDQTATILIVDDNPANLGVLSDTLDQAGLEVWVAQSGKIALERVKYARPHLILLDVMMPEIDGFETCRQLKARPETKDIPVIFMTCPF
jgi:CheY-like chemotaxis protein